MHHINTTLTAAGPCIPVSFELFLFLCTVNVIQLCPPCWFCKVSPILWAAMGMGGSGSGALHTVCHHSFVPAHLNPSFVEPFVFRS